MNLKISSLFALAGATIVAPATAIAAKPAKATRPNVIIMLADDMGYDDMSLRGNTTVSTPALDKFAQEATSFENFYVHSVSAPTRASLLTGRHFLRTGISGVHAGRDFMNLDEVTIAEAFQEEGYATGMWGKWHSGKTSGYYPWQRGFDEAYMAGLYQYENNKGELNGEKVETKGWADAVIADMAVDFIKKNKKKPFFAYIPFLSPHGVWKAPKEYVDRKMAEGQSETQATLTGMIEHLDDQVAKVIAAVEKQGLLDNTIIIFMSDNGPIRSGGGNLSLSDEEWAQRNPSQYRGNKGQNFENGIHSPLFIYWKGHYEGAVNESLLAVYDLFPTLCDIADIEIPHYAKEMDGISFKEILEDPTITKTDRTVFISQWTPFIEWHDTNGDNQALPLSPAFRNNIDPTIQMTGVRTGDYKLLYNMWGEDTIALWNIREDYKESQNLYLKGTAEDKDLAVKYRNQVVEWYEEVLADQSSYRMPTFQIGIEGIGGKTQIYCYAPIEISEGMINRNHYLGFNKAGESAQYLVNVVEHGKYSVGIRANHTFKGEATFRVFTNLNDNCGEVTINKKATSFIPLQLNKDVKYIGIELISESSVGGEIQLVNLDVLRK